MDLELAIEALISSRHLVKLLFRFFRDDVGRGRDCSADISVELCESIFMAGGIQESTVGVP